MELDSGIGNFDEIWIGLTGLTGLGGRELDRINKIDRIGDEVEVERLRKERDEGLSFYA